MNKWVKRILPALLVCMLMGGTMSLVSSGADYGSNGKFLETINSPVSGSIAISTRAQLEAIKNDLSGKYHLTANIDLSGAEWVPIGDSYSGTPFKGTFDGQGYVIRSLKITGEGYENNGLFGCIVAATVKNVGMEGTNINVSRSSATTAGAVCGVNNGYIRNCYNTGNISGITNSDQGSQGVYAGGICGSMGNSSFAIPSSHYCFNTGDISAKTTTASSANAYAGGISGYAGSEIGLSNSFNTGAIYSQAYSTSTKSGLGASAYSGGICGSNGSSVSTNGSVYICYNAGNVTAVNPGSLYGNGVYAGGISGSGPQKNCFNTGAISATGAYYSYAGGIAGRIDTGSSINNYNIGTVNASNGSQTTMSGGISTSKNVSNSYCLDLYGSEYGTQLTSAQMKNKVNFVGFDFNAIWDISPTVNNGYPHLRAFTSQTEPPVPTTAPVPTTTMPAPTTTNNSGGGGGGNNSPTTTQTPTTTQPTTTSPGGDNTTQPSKTIFNTRYVSTFWNWFKFIVLFGFIWMWFI